LHVLETSATRAICVSRKVKKVFASQGPGAEHPPS